MNRSGKQTDSDPTDSNSVTLSVGVFWILPMLCIAILSRFAVDTGPPFVPNPSRPVSLSFDGAEQATRPTPRTVETSSPTSVPSSEVSKDKISSLFLSNKPFSYQEVVKAIARRRLDWTTVSVSQVTPHPKERESVSKTPQHTSAGGNEQQQQQQHSSTPARGASSDPARLELLRQISQFREDYQVSPFFSILGLSSMM